MKRRMRARSSSGRRIPRSAYCTERMMPTEVSISVPSRSKITQSYRLAAMGNSPFPFAPKIACPAPCAARSA